MLKVVSCGQQLLRVMFLVNTRRGNTHLRTLTCLRTGHVRTVACTSSLVQNYSVRLSFINRDSILFNYPAVKDIRKYSSNSSEAEPGQLNRLEYDKFCNETLESLYDYFEDVVEGCEHIRGCDVTFNDGVLTIQLGEHGTYVINRQTPNRQIWLSSPSSGPKRYDYVKNKKCWIYRHDNRSLHDILQEEISKITKNKLNFFDCAHSGR
ncbi:frataxin [Lycorma delicatula]|uniref:frataxin n=1 Tax=Lycorma delicatula TaxID=130591 RepID=UPI003F5172A7